MKCVMQCMLIALIGSCLGCVVTPAPEYTSSQTAVVQAPAAPITCTPPHRLRIVDLDVIPDPVRTGQPVQAWRITIRSDWNGECGTFFEVRDRDQIAASGYVQAIRPGTSVYTLPATPHYRFQRRDHCYAVLANIGGAFTSIATQRNFCAQLIPGAGWTLRGT